MSNGNQPRRLGAEMNWLTASHALNVNHHCFQD